jgi:small conductance mechanosensitive channel
VSQAVHFAFRLGAAAAACAWMVVSSAPAAAMQAQAPASNPIRYAVRESFQRLIAAAANVLPSIVVALVILAIFWGLASLARWLVRMSTTFVRDATVRVLITQVSYYLVWAIGVVVTLDALGINLQAVVTAFGLGSVALGFALKDILSNLVSGVLILAMRPFAIGDQIVIGETEGTVEQIELRATQIRTYDGRLVLVPNAEVFTSRITNNTASPFRRASVYVCLDYKEDTARALSVILDTVKSVPGVASTPPPSMRLRDFNQDGLQLEARFWTESRRNNLMNTASAARVAILAALKAAGIQLPDPDQRYVVIASTSPEDASAGVSPRSSITG